MLGPFRLRHDVLCPRLTTAVRAAPALPRRQMVFLRRRREASPHLPELLLSVLPMQVRLRRLLCTPVRPEPRRHPLVQTRGNSYPHRHLRLLRSPRRLPRRHRRLRPRQWLSLRLPPLTQFKPRM